MFRSPSDKTDSVEDSRELFGSICRDTMSKQSTRKGKSWGHPVGFVPLSKFCLRSLPSVLLGNEFGLAGHAPGAWLVRDMRRVVTLSGKEVLFFCLCFQFRVCL
jgi:hypothetical protein